MSEKYSVFIFLDKGISNAVYATVSIISPGDDYSRGQH